jgi:predicted nucleic acid-binding protein
MSQVELVADTHVTSYLFRRDALGQAYRALTDERPTGVTLLTIAEARSGTVSNDWGYPRIASLDRFLSRFFVLEATAEIANLCGTIIGCCKQVGRAMSWPDAWSAATALWLDVPLVTHDRDVEGIPGLRVVTAHTVWRVCEDGFGNSSSAPLWLGEDARTLRYRASEMTVM